MIGQPCMHSLVYPCYPVITLLRGFISFFRRKEKVVEGELLKKAVFSNLVPFIPLALEEGH